MPLPRPRRLLHVAVLLVPALGSGTARAQAPPADVDTTLALDRVLVTATRTAKDLADVAVPATVVGAAEMRQQGAVRLADVLEAIPGLALFDDHGTGLQVQGFAPDYTLILIDGEPVVGRTAGTLELDRLTVQGLERVEVVRGPSSSLYGSEALAGVVNLITRRPGEGLTGSVETRVGSFGRTDLTATAEAGAERAGVRVLVDRHASAGYDLSPGVFGPTAPAFTDWTADVRARARLGPGTAARLGVRLARQDQEGAFALAEGGAETRYADTGERREWSVHPEVEQRLSDRLRLTGTLYAAGYATRTRYTREADGGLYFADDFDQQMAKAEAQLDALWGPRHRTVLGVGATGERLGGDRYAPDADGNRPRAAQGWAFAQHEWLPGRLLEVNASARFDAHEDYAARLSPKLALLVRPVDGVRVRASVGSGFKAPAFRQLYLAFTNAAAGYSVFGATRLAEGLAQLQADGQVAQVLLDPAALGAIQAESSVAYNVGVAVTPLAGATLSADVFHNDVRDLIETQPVAQKTNGQFVYGYFNLDRIYTRGVQAEASFAPAAGPLAGLSLALGYQYLQARDRAVVEALERGAVFGRDPDGREYRVRLADYTGLFGRSPHAATLRAAWAVAGTGTALSVRARWRSRYGYRDLDGNGVANRPDEGVPAYGLLDATVTQRLALPGRAALDLQVGVDNAFGLTRPASIPSLPGRQLYASVRVSL